jgi:AcrR family transcriptional regulator
MPKIVDHEARREEITEAAWNLISRDGIAAATTRNIAKAVGCSNGILSHYFADKAELLEATLQLGYDRVEAQILDARSRLRGMAALREVLLLAVAITPDKLVGNKVELAYLGEAVGSPKRMREHFAIFQRYRAIVREVLVEARGAGEIARELNLDVTADTLVAIVDGIGTEAALYSDAFPAKRQAKVIDAVLDRLAAKPLSVPHLSPLGEGRRQSRRVRGRR